MDARDRGPADGAGCLRATMPELPGYEARRRLGEGGSSVVWLVRRRDDGTLVAARIETATLPSSGPGRADRASTLGSAAAALGPIAEDHLAHPRGETIARCGLPDHRHRAVLMDHLPGGSLAEVVAARGPLSPGETVTVVAPLAQLLAVGHAAGLTHGDVSPGNVLFAIDGRPVLADWELAGRPGRPGPPDAGTDGFRDPAVTSEGLLRPAADVYALAALAWFCLTGRVPGPAEHRPPLPILVPAVPRELAVLLDRGLDPDPGMRPGAAELARGVFASAPPEPVDLHASAHASVRPELVTRMDAPLRRRRRSIRADGPGTSRAAARSWEPYAARRRDGGGPTAAPLGRRSSPRPVVRRRWVLVAVLLAAALGGGAALATPTPGTGGALSRASRPPAARSSTDPTGSSAPTEVLRPSPALVSPRAVSPGTNAPASRSPRATGSLPTPTSPQPDPVASADPVAAARALTMARARAFRDGSWDRLADVTVPGSPAAAADHAAAAALIAASGRLDGLGIEVTCARSIAAPAESTERAVVRICARFSGYRQLDGRGALVRTVAASPVQDVDLHLTRSGGRWRIDRVQASGR
ncbi:hypothetical protein V6N00_10365 [Tersicoccus sp. MR15.9]|uniref:protein kinase domain-containing protein n=1 Tax=Tersicoccus mangrovi TaxID=3121635 RepID=UPI002FE67115